VEKSDLLHATALVSRRRNRLRRGCDRVRLRGVLARAPSIPIAGVEDRSSKFAALQARVDAILPNTKGAFRFARERDDEVSELPNPLPPRRAIN
jgi:hypothetical protein